MKSTQQLRKALETGELGEKLSWLYCCGKEEAGQAAERYLRVLDGLDATFGAHPNAALFSAPGRTEIGGNHTDHQHGCVVAGSVNMDMLAAVGENDLGTVRLMSEGYECISVELRDLDKRPEEENTSLAILRGTCKAYADRGAQLRGLDIYVASHVPKGSGISSSAAFEVLLGTVLSALCMPEPLTPVEIAQIGQWVENVYFGKPCGLMDQMASSVGGVVAIDFKDPGAPVVKPIALNLQEAGLALCILDSGADHADLTDEYAAVPAECKAVAKELGAEFLRDTDRETLLANLAHCREAAGDRAVLRAMHFFDENERAQQEAEALERRDYPAFLELVRSSGRSSWLYLQNVTPVGSKQHQAVAVALALAELYAGAGSAVRVHGGGFAGTIQAFVPLDRLDVFKQEMERHLGCGSCHVMAIRPAGGVRLA